MPLNEEEIKQYESLSPRGQYYYNYSMREHHDWTHIQAFTNACVCLQMEENLNQSPEPQPPNLNMIFRAVLQKAENFMQEHFPDVYQRVKQSFADVVRWIRNAVNITIEKIIDFFK